jgi:hypothetical protein
MAEQDLRRDPATGFYLSDRRSADAHQNDNYTRHVDPHLTVRDYSRPQTIPADEFEETTGQRHDHAVTEWEQNERARLDAEEKAARAA